MIPSTLTKSIQLEAGKQTRKLKQSDDEKNKQVAPGNSESTDEPNSKRAPASSTVEEQQEDQESTVIDKGKTVSQIQRDRGDQPLNLISSDENDSTNSVNAAPSSLANLPE